MPGVIFVGTRLVYPLIIVVGTGVW